MKTTTGFATFFVRLVSFSVTLEPVPSLRAAGISHAQFDYITARDGVLISTMLPSTYEVFGGAKVQESAIVTPIMGAKLVGGRKNKRPALVVVAKLASHVQNWWNFVSG